MKRFLMILLAASCLLLAGCSSAKTAPADADQATLYRAGLFSAPSSGNASLITTIPAGVAVEVLETEGGWSRVQYGGFTGYVYSSFLAPYTVVAAQMPKTTQAAETAEALETPSMQETQGQDVAGTEGAPEASAVANADPVPSQPAQTATGVHELPMEALDAIVAKYDGTVVGYGVDGPRLEDNSPEQVRTYQKRMTQFGVKNIGSESGRSLYLTFPMGWEKSPNTVTVLDILKAKGVKATFYVTHEYADLNPDIIRRIIDEGHEIGSHGYSHPADGIATLPLWEQQSDAMRMQRYMQETYGYTMRKYNFNYSAWSEQAIALMSQMGYEVCFYSFNYVDYDVNNQQAIPETLQQLVDAMFPGCIYYLHTVSDTNVAVLADFIDAARAQGYRFDPL